MPHNFNIVFVPKEYIFAFGKNAFSIPVYSFWVKTVKLCGATGDAFFSAWLRLRTFLFEEAF